MHSEKSSEISTDVINKNQIHSISAINKLSDNDKQEVYSRLIPRELLQRFNIPDSFLSHGGESLLRIKIPNSSPSVEMELYHQPYFRDPILYGHITDTINGKIHILLYILNDPTSPRFDIDILPDGTPTGFGAICRNISQELAAMDFGLAPGQIRRGLRLLGTAIQGFEEFVASLGQDFYFAEPLYYHNALLFERYGFAYSRGKILMKRIEEGFRSGGDLFSRLDGSTPFRSPVASNSIRLRSWALHDGIMGVPFTDVTMYKKIGSSFNVNTCAGCDW